MAFSGAGRTSGSVSGLAMLGYSLMVEMRR